MKMEGIILMKLGEINVDLVDKMGDDLTVVRAARVSYANTSDWNSQIHKGEYRVLMRTRS